MNDRIDRVLGYLLLTFAAVLPWSIAAAQAAAYGSLALWAFDRARRRDFSALRHPYMPAIMLFMIAALISSAFGLRPATSLVKCRRLLLFLLPAVIYDIGRRREEGPLSFARGMILAFLTGTLLLGAHDLVRQGWRMLHVPEGQSALAWLYDGGNMRDPQFYMVALCLLLAAWPLGPTPGVAFRGSALLFYSAGLLLHFKRGVWLAAALALTALAAVGRKKRLLLAIALCALAAMATPQVRHRLAALRTEADANKGGRLGLWTRVAPAMIRENPLGIGLAAARNEDFRALYPQVEPKLNHLHNNALQVTLETGWLGLAVWLYWMILTFLLLGQQVRAFAGRGPPGRWIALGLFSAFLGLMLNGMVEYNFGDSEILMLLVSIMGWSLLLREDVRRRAAASA